MGSRHYMYRVTGSWLDGGPFVERCSVVSGPDAEGRLRVRSRAGGEQSIHGDWLYPSPEEAIAAAEAKQVREHEARMATLASLRRATKGKL